MLGQRDRDILSTQNPLEKLAEDVLKLDAVTEQQQLVSWSQNLGPSRDYCEVTVNVPEI